MIEKFDYSVEKFNDHGKWFLDLIPELKILVGFKQNIQYHIYDVWDHTLAALAACRCPDDFIVMTSLLLHDIGKPFCYTRDEKGIGHFYDHEVVSAGMAGEILKRFALSEAEKQQIVELIQNHCSHLSGDRKWIKKQAFKHSGCDYVRKMLLIREADLLAHNAWRSVKRLRAVREIIDSFQERSEGIDYENAIARQLLELEIDGSDLMTLGYKEGPEVGKELNYLAKLVVDGKLQNEKSALSATATSDLWDPITKNPDITATAAVLKEMGCLEEKEPIFIQSKMFLAEAKGIRLGYAYSWVGKILYSAELMADIDRCRLLSASVLNHFCLKESAAEIVHWVNQFGAYAEKFGLTEMEWYNLVATLMFWKTQQTEEEAIQTTHQYWCEYPLDMIERVAKLLRTLGL